MILCLPPEVRSRLDRIEREEGIPQIDFAYQAIDIWSTLDEADRRMVGLGIMRILLQKIRHQ